jgi:hypothetical protein
MFKKNIVVLFINIGLTSAFSKKNILIDTLKIKPYDPLCPAKVSFCLAIVPGLVKSIINNIEITFSIRTIEQVLSLYR